MTKGVTNAATPSRDNLYRSFTPYAANVHVNEATE
jgi:hypothetical protein